MPRLPLDRAAHLEGTFQDSLRPSLSLGAVRVFMCLWNPFFFFSSAAAVSNNWGLGGVEEALGSIINRTKHPKWGQVPFFLSFSFPVDSNGNSSEGKTCIQIVPSHFFYFLFTVIQSLGFIFPLLHSICEEENALQSLKAQGRIGTSPSHLPESLNLPCSLDVWGAAQAKRKKGEAWV